MSDGEAELLRWAFFNRIINTIAPLCTWLKVAEHSLLLEKVQRPKRTRANQTETEYEVYPTLNGNRIGKVIIRVSDRDAGAIKTELGTACIMALGEILKLWSEHQSMRAAKTQTAVRYIMDYFEGQKI